MDRASRHFLYPTPRRWHTILCINSYFTLLILIALFVHILACRFLTLTLTLALALTLTPFSPLLLP